MRLLIPLVVVTVVLLLAKELLTTTRQRGEEGERLDTTAERVSQSIERNLSTHQKKLEDALNQSTNQPATE